MRPSDTIDVLKRNYPSACYEDLREAVNMAIKALSELQDRKKGKWIYEGIRGRFPACRCSVCGSIENADWAVIQDGANFCPHCGADMREETEDGQSDFETGGD